MKNDKTRKNKILLNKRVAFAACDVFLRINGYTLNADSGWFFQRMMAWLEGSEDRFEQITQNLKSCPQCRISRSPSDAFSTKGRKKKKALKRNSSKCL